MDERRDVGVDLLRRGCAGCTGKIFRRDSDESLQDELRARPRYAGRHFAIDRQAFRKICDTMAAGDARPQFIIFGRLTRRIGRIDANAIEGRLSYHHRGMHEGIVEEKIEPQDLVFGGMIMKAPARPITDPYLRARADQRVFGIDVEEGYLLCDPARIGQVVMVLPCKIPPACQGNAAIKRRRQTRTRESVMPSR